MHTYRITGTVPLDDGNDTFHPDAVASMIGAEVGLFHNFRWDDSIGKVTVEGASVDSGGDLRLTIAYNEATDKRLREHGYGRKSLKMLSIGGTIDAAEEPADEGARRLIREFTLREVCPRIEPPSAPRVVGKRETRG